MKKLSIIKQKKEKDKISSGHPDPPVIPVPASVNSSLNAPVHFFLIFPTWCEQSISLASKISKVALAKLQQKLLQLGFNLMR